MPCVELQALALQEYTPEGRLEAFLLQIFGGFSVVGSLGNVSRSCSFITFCQSALERFKHQMIRTIIAHRKSLLQKKNRYKVYEQNRHLGLKDVNIPLEGRDLVNIHEMSQDLAPEKASTKMKSEKMVLSDQWKQFFQKYREEKQLQKLKEQHKKAKGGVFKVGLYTPAAPGFLITDQRSVRAEPEKAFPFSGQITRSKAKDHMEYTKIDGRDVCSSSNIIWPKTNF